ncbi:restriction endonuclease subunit S [Streptomyces sp. NBC_01387]|uniref:restriction endonuclease subunit S n=1 Tax=Streptomyces sp. NBC_01387 TaxID=2903849 RepID=UPI0032478906
MSAYPHVLLGDFCEIVSGGTPKTAVAEFWDGEVSWATPKDLSGLPGKYIDDTPRKITEAGLRGCAATVLPEGSVLLSSRAPIGHVAINTIPMATNQGFKSLIPDANRADANYLYHWLKAHRAYLDLLGNGATFKEISKAVVAKVAVPLPPLAVQRRIAQALDHVGALRVKRRQTLSLLDDLVQSLFLDMFGDGIEEGWWPTLSLADAVSSGTIVTYGIVQAGDEYLGGVPYIRTGDIKDGKILAGQLRRTDPAIAAKFSRSRVDVGDIVMSIRATVGTTAPVTAEIAGANLTQGTAKISPGGSVTHFYLLHFLRSRRAQEWIAAQVKGATFREITLTKLRELSVSIPPLSLQEEFSRRVSEIENLRPACVTHLAELDALFASLQHRAFRGELWPDEAVTAA